MIDAITRSKEKQMAERIEKDRREHERRKCASCHGEENGYCDEHKMALSQIEATKGLPSAVNKMNGILGLIGTLITLLIGLLFNAHFENQKSMEIHAEKFNSLSSQISKLEIENDKAISSIRTEVLKLSITFDQIEKHREKEDNKDKK
jgi:hypothetical protein